MIYALVAACGLSLSDCEVLQDRQGPYRHVLACLVRTRELERVMRADRPDLFIIARHCRGLEDMRRLIPGSFAFIEGEPA